MYPTHGTVLAVLLHARAAVAHDNVTSNSIDFVDVIKQNLRRNNDDYIDTSGRNDLRSSAIGSDRHADDDPSKLEKGAATEVNDSIMNAGNGNRRANGERSWEFDNDDKKTQTVSSTATGNRTGHSLATKESLRLHSNLKLKKYKSHFKRNISKLNNNEMQISNHKESPTDPSESKLAHIPNLTKNIRKDKFKKFMLQNRDLLKVLNSKPKLQAGQTRLTQQKFNTDPRELDPNALINRALRVKAADDDKNAGLPDPQLLDMAPARGGRIHRLRVKGRLCFRHVLLPEGPKYDSNGRWYVPEHGRVARHPYDVTPGPRMVLPRCCNCCKKSVLGCQ